MYMTAVFLIYETWVSIHSLLFIISFLNIKTNFSHFYLGSYPCPTIHILAFLLVTFFYLSSIKNHTIALLYLI